MVRKRQKTKRVSEKEGEIGKERDENEIDGENKKDRRNVW